MSLQGMVDELIMKKEGRKITRVMICLLLFIANVASAFSLIISSLSSNNDD